MEGDYLVVLTKDWIVIRVMDAAERPEVGLVKIGLRTSCPVRLSARRANPQWT